MRRILVKEFDVVLILKGLLMNVSFQTWMLLRFNINFSNSHDLNNVKLKYSINSRLLSTFSTSSK